ncbi:MAG: ADP-glyceromanno-heptose 6-epimerase [Bacteriovoracaceae bacterium]|nr:ADP-glyceromanno-heptose 6-epimerase [Bacteriovoracaceae bacterium]
MILVTGGAGFIGSVLVQQLNNAGRDDIIVVDRLKDTTKWLNLRSKKYEQYIHSEDFFHNTSLISRISLILHMGACSSTSEADMDYLMKNNVEYSKRLFEIATVQKIPIIYASSAATYGDGSLGFSDDHQMVTKFLPINRYGYSKQLFDEWVLKQKRYPPFWCGLKFFNVYGPCEYHKGDMRSVVFKAFEQIEENGSVKLFKSYRDEYEDGKQLRDFIYVLDIAKAIMMIIDQKMISPHSGIYNMGTGEARSFNDLVSATFKAQDIPPKIEYIDMPCEMRSRYQYFTQAKMDKFLNLFPDFEFTNLEVGITDYVQNYLMNENRYFKRI